MELIGLSGYARSGKDEAAKVLVERHGFTRVAFADKLREALYQLNPLVAYKPYFNYGIDPPSGYTRVFLQEVINVYGWDGYKETEFGEEIRRLAQRMGTEAGRNTLGENIWVNAALTGLPEDAKVVVTDCRFPNEATAIVGLGGTMVRVTRPGITAVNAHISETSLDHWDFDYTLENNQNGLENWYNEVAYWYELKGQLHAADIGG